MSRQRATFGKLQRERDKQAKAKAKRERRLAAAEAGAEEQDERPSAPDVEASQVAVMELIADLHRRFENAEIGFEDYEEEKAALLSRLPID